MCRLSANFCDYDVTIYVIARLLIYISELLFLAGTQAALALSSAAQLIG